MPRKKNSEKLSIWPVGFANPDTEIEGSLSPIPIMVVTGTPGSGKTTFGFQIDPVPMDKPTRTLFFDLEKGSTSASLQYAVDRIDLMQHMEDNFDSWKPAQLWSEWLRLATERTLAKSYTTLVVDTAYPLQDGAFEYVKANRQSFGVLSSDTRLILAAGKNYMKTEFSKLAARVQTLVFVMHLKNKFDENKNAPKEKEPQGVETFYQLATLVLHLHRDPYQKIVIRGKQYPACPKYPYPSGFVLKSRLSYTNFGETDAYGDPKISPLLPDFMEVCTPGSIRQYMSKPQREFAESAQKPEHIPGLNAEPLTEDQKAQMELEKKRLELEQEIVKRKGEIINQLIADGLYENGMAIGRAVTDLGLNYSIENHEGFLAALTQYAHRNGK